MEILVFRLISEIYKLLIILIFSFLLVSCVKKEIGKKYVNICDVVNNIEKYDGADVTFEAYAEAALHDFDVALYDNKCRDRNIFLRAGKKFNGDTTLMFMIKKLYPGYPNDYGCEETSVHVKLSGRIFRRKDHGLLITYVDLDAIQVMGASS